MRGLLLRVRVRRHSLNAVQRALSTVHPAPAIRAHPPLEEGPERVAMAKPGTYPLWVSKQSQVLIG
jgi:hypothetical protein